VVGLISISNQNQVTRTASEQTGVLVLASTLRKAENAIKRFLNPYLNNGQNDPDK
jgi:hypothetical protein